MGPRSTSLGYLAPQLLCHPRNYCALTRERTRDLVTCLGSGSEPLSSLEFQKPNPYSAGGQGWEELRRKEEVP